MKNKSYLCHISLGIFLSALFLFLLLRASHEDHWSEWAGADAQTMLSARNWNEKGWVANKFLFLPQGYFKDIHLLDGPQLRQHAHGISPDASPFVGPRLWYTHYPPGYLVPYTLLFKLVKDNIFCMRMLALCFSIGALILMYILFSKITNPAVSFLSVFFYGLTPAFLGYADTLSNQPVDDILRFAFMLLVVLSTRTTLLNRKKVFMIAAWLVSFFLSLSSFDSVFFIYLWLAGWDLLEHRGFRWKTYIVFALAPLIAQALLFLQNAWYLGLKDAFLDIKGTFQVKSFLYKSYNYSLLARLVLIFPVLETLLNNLFKPAELIVLLLIIYFIYVKVIRSRDSGLPSFGLLVLLFSCGLIFGAIFPYVVLKIPSLARQMAPFAALLAGGAACSFWREMRLIREKAASGRPVRIFYVLLSGVVVFIFLFYFVILDRRPEIDKVISENHPDILLAQNIRLLTTRYEPVIFQLDGFGWVGPYVRGYPEIHPILEYSAGSRTILSFTTPEGISQDLSYLLSHSRYRFSPILVTSDLNVMKSIVFDLRKHISLKQVPAKIYISAGRFVLDLTDFII